MRHLLRLLTAVATFSVGVTLSLVWDIGGAIFTEVPDISPAAPTFRTDAGASLPCHVHGTAMRFERVPIRYGNILMSQKAAEAEQKLFPHSNSYISGGCVLPAKPAAEGIVLVCPDCRAAGEVWRRRHPKEGL